ncbi:MAG: hypothetical protein ACJ8LG_15845 [Massilia sp.]
MNELNPGTTFRGLPLTPDQEREVEHYIHARERCGAEWDTAELRAMLADMLNPPEVVDDDEQSLDDSIASERTTAFGEETTNEQELRSEREQQHQERD